MWYLSSPEESDRQVCAGFAAIVEPDSNPAAHDARLSPEPGFFQPDREADVALAGPGSEYWLP